MESHTICEVVLIYVINYYDLICTYGSEKKIEDILFKYEINIYNKFQLVTRLYELIK